jgi:hypothetical protein
MSRGVAAASAALLSTSLACAAGPVVTPDPFALVEDALDTGDFVGQGVVQETVITADFNADGQSDVAMVVKNEERRVLIVLLAKQEGGLRRVGIGELDPYPLGDASLAAPKGVLVIEDLTGGTTAIQSTYRYRYEAASGRMQLIGDDVALYSRTNSHGGVEVSTNRLTGVRLTQTSEPDEAKGEYRFSAQKRSTAPKDKLYIETAPSPEDTVGPGDGK